MALYDDDFQGYSIGDSVPFGGWILDNSAITNVIVAGHAPDTMSQSYRLFGNIVIDPSLTGPLGGAYFTSFTVFVAIWKAQGSRILAFANGPNLTGHIFEILAVKVEGDSTISVTGPLSEVLANSKDAWLEFNSVNFLQVNVSLSDVMVSGVNHIHIDCQIALNGVKVIDFSATTGAPVTDLANATSEVNKFQLQANEAFYSAFTLDSLQSLPSYPHAGTPKMLVYQGPLEVDVVPDSAKLRVMQAVLEVDLVLPNRWHISES